MSFLRDFKVAIRSLSRVPALWFAVAHPGAGHRRKCRHLQRGACRAPAAARQSRRRSPALRARKRARNRRNCTTFSVPEIKDIDTGLKSIKEFGTFSLSISPWWDGHRARSPPESWTELFSSHGPAARAGPAVGPRRRGPNAAAPPCSRTGSGATRCIPIPA